MQRPQFEWQPDDKGQTWEWHYQRIAARVWHPIPIRHHITSDLPQWRGIYHFWWYLFVDCTYDNETQNGRICRKQSETRWTCREWGHWVPDGDEDTYVAVVCADQKEVDVASPCEADASELDASGLDAPGLAHRDWRSWFASTPKAPAAC